MKIAVEMIFELQAASTGKVSCLALTRPIAASFSYEAQCSVAKGTLPS
jgi:hypothetical protein